MEKRTNEHLRTQIQEAIANARTMRDEIRVSLHLAGMDAQDKWRELEPKLADAERLGQELSETARVAATNVAKSAVLPRKR